jgi:hypothetical protein
VAFEFLENGQIEAVVWSQRRAHLVLIERMGPVPIFVVVQILINVGGVTAFLEAPLWVLHFTPISQLRINVVSVEISSTLTGPSARSHAYCPRFTIHTNNKFNKSRDHFSRNSRL